METWNDPEYYIDGKYYPFKRSYYEGLVEGLNFSPCPTDGLMEVGVRYVTEVGTPSRPHGSENRGMEVSVRFRVKLLKRCPDEGAGDCYHPGGHPGTIIGESMVNIPLPLLEKIRPR